MASSEKLKELQLQIQQDAEALQQEISVKETHLTGGTSEILASDPSEPTDSERRTLLRKQQAQQVLWWGGMVLILCLLYIHIHTKE